MGFQIEDGTGSGHVAQVTSTNQVKTITESHELQHHISRNFGQSYQVISTDTGITAATQTILHLKNTDTTRKMVISFIRMQAITNTASKPVVGEYFQMGLGRTVSSGGTEVTPVNVNASSGNVASVVATGVDPTMAGTFSETDRWYNEGNNEHSYNKQGSHILGLNDTFEVRLVSAGTGEAYCRITFMMIDFNGD